LAQGGGFRGNRYTGSKPVITGLLDAAPITVAEAARLMNVSEQRVADGKAVLTYAAPNKKSQAFQPGSQFVSFPRQSSRRPARPDQAAEGAVLLSLAAMQAGRSAAGAHHHIKHAIDHLPILDRALRVAAH
jgi:hypothetical protein